jgi:hypothetical protein
VYARIWTKIFSDEQLPFDCGYVKFSNQRKYYAPDKLGAHRLRLCLARSPSDNSASSQLISREINPENPYGRDASLLDEKLEEEVNKPALKVAEFLPENFEAGDRHRTGDVHAKKI